MNDYDYGQQNIQDYVQAQQDLQHQQGHDFLKSIATTGALYAGHKYLTRDQQQDSGSAANTVLGVLAVVGILTVLSVAIFVIYAIF